MNDYCTNKIEVRVNELEGVKEANLNFSLGRIVLSISEEISKEDIINKVKKIVNDLEPDVVVREYKVDKIKKINNKGVLNHELHVNKVQQYTHDKCCSFRR